MDPAKSVVTLTLTVPALERLFEGDPTIVLILKEAAVAEFVRRKIGNYMSGESQAAIENEIKRQIGARDFQGKVKINQAISDAVLHEAGQIIEKHKTRITEFAKEFVRRQLEDRAIDEAIERVVGEELIRQAAGKVKAEVARRLDRALKAAEE